MSWVAASDPLALLALQTIPATPATEGAAVGTTKLDTDQVAARLGEPVPVVFARRRNQSGGVLISPRATEARFQNNQSTNAVTAFYHLVLSEGELTPIERRDVYQGQSRVGSYTQTYDRRAGTWAPGNFIVSVSGFDTPNCPQYCGTVGAYPDISTMSFSVTVPNGDDAWRKQVHAFIRNGMPVQRLFDNTFGPSDNFCDLLKWAWLRTRRLPLQLIDVPSLTLSAAFLERYKLFCNAEFRDSSNLPDLIAQWARYFLLRETNINGQKGLRPVLPVTASGELIAGPITPVYTFTDDVIMPDSFEVNYTPLADRLPFVAQVMWRQHPDGHDIDTVRTAEVRFAGEALDGPYESHDLSQICTSELHAVQVGAHIVSRRKRSTHSARLVAKPQIHNQLLNQGDVVRVRLRRETTGQQVRFHDYLYQVERISKSLKGNVNYELSHFPIDTQGASLITQDLLAVEPTGIILPPNRTGPTGDNFGPEDRTLPDDDGLPIGSDPPTGDGVPDPEFPEIEVPGINAPEFGSGGSSGGSGDPTVPEDALDELPPTLERFPPGPLLPGTALVMPENPCGEGNPPPVWRWLRGDEILRGHTKRYQVIGTAEIQVGNGPPLRGEYRCATDEDWNPLIDETFFLDNLPPGREVELNWTGTIRRYGPISGFLGWWPSGTYFYKVTLREYIDFEGKLATDDEVYRVNPDGTIDFVTRGANAEFWVTKSRFRDNGGPWQELYDYSQFL